MFNNKKDVLLESIKKVLQESDLHRQLEAQLNEAYGISSRAALPREYVAEYNAILAEAKRTGSLPTTAKEKALAQHHGDPKRITQGDVLKARGVVEEGIAKVYNRFMQKRTGKKADHAYDMNDEKEFAKQVDKSEKYRVKAGGKPTKINTDPNAKFLTMREDNLSSIQEEIRNSLWEKLNYVYENYGEDAAQYAYDSLTEEEQNILSRAAKSIGNFFSKSAASPQGDSSRDHAEIGALKRDNRNPPAPPAQTPTKGALSNSGRGTVAGGINDGRGTINPTSSAQGIATAMKTGQTATIGQTYRNQGDSSRDHAEIGALKRDNRNQGDSSRDHAEIGALKRDNRNPSARTATAKQRQPATQINPSGGDDAFNRAKTRGDFSGITGSGGA